RPPGAPARRSRLPPCRRAGSARWKAAASGPARPAAPSPRRCAPWRRANWSCPGRCRPRAAAGAARATAPAPKSGTAPSGFQGFVGGVDFFAESLQEHELSYEIPGGTEVTLAIDFFLDLVFDFTSFNGKTMGNGIQIRTILRH